MLVVRIVIFLALAIPASAACGFEYEPMKVETYFRAEGWVLPGTADYNPKARARIYGAPMFGKMPDEVKVELLPHDEDPYVVEFPAQEFVLDSARRKLLAKQVKATIIRFKIGNRVVAYSYGLIPISAYRQSEKWVIEWEAGCIFPATFIDDKGDGVFRVLVPGNFTQDLIPRWAKHEPES